MAFFTLEEILLIVFKKKKKSWKCEEFSLFFEILYDFVCEKPTVFF